MSILEYAQEGDVEKLSELLDDPDKHANVNVKDDNYGQTPISWACERGHKDVVELLLEHNADVEVTDKNSQGPLHYAAWNDRFDIVKLLLNKSPGNINQQNSTGQTPISFAVEAGHKEIVQLLLDNGADVEINDKMLQGPLHWAAKKGHLEIVRLLLKNEKIRQHLDDQDSQWGQTPISLAAEEGHKNVVELLLESNANENLPDSENKLPLNVAGMENRTEVISLFLNRITDIGYKDTTGRSLLSWAVEYPNISKWDINVLLEHHDIDSPDDRNRTAVHYAARGGSIESLEILLKKGAKSDEIDIFGFTPLSIAAQKGHLELVQKLCEIESDVNSPDNDGNTPLACAILEGHTGVVKELVKARSDLYSKNFEGETPIVLAVMADNSQILEAIIEYEYKPTSTEGEQQEQGPYIRTRLVEEALYYCLSTGRNKDMVLAKKNYLKAQDLEGRSLVSWAAEKADVAVFEALNDQEVEWDAVDNNGRTPLSWAAASKREDAREIVQVLLKKGARVDARDKDHRTALSWASENGNKGVVDELLEQKATADLKDNDGRTPLSIASGKGHLAIVERLLDLVSVTAKPTHELPKERTSRKQEHDKKALEKKAEDKKASKSQEVPERPTRGAHDGTSDRNRVEVNSVDNNSLTPLSYAAIYNHAQVVGVLLDHGADIRLSGIEQKSLRVDGKEVGIKGRILDIIENKRIDRRLATKRFAASDVVDGEFTALVVHFQAKDESELRFEMPRVQDLLDKGDTLPQDTVPSCKWLHIPANNMRWVEVCSPMRQRRQQGTLRVYINIEQILMANHYEGAGPGHQTTNRTVLNRNWMDHQHRTQKPWPYHSRFMRPDCQLLPPLSEKDTIAATNNDTLPSQGFVLFMPYLHWERKDEFQKLKKIMDKKEEKLKANRGTENTSFGYEEARIQEAIDEIKRSGENLNGTEKMYWMYLDQRHPLHPRRTLDQYYYHTLDDTSERDGDQTAARYYKKMKVQCEENNIGEVLTMVDQLWMWVLPQCGQAPCTVITAFPQRSNRTKPTTALLDNIRSTCSNMPPRHGYDLAHIIAAECGRTYLDRTSRRDDSIQFYDIYSSAIAELTHSETHQFQNFQKAIEKLKKQNEELKGANSLRREEAGSERRRVLEELVDIEQDIKNLKEIKDIQDELNIMSAVFTTQKNVIETMHRIVESEDKLGHSSPLTVVQNNLREVQSLMNFAQMTSEAIQQLLDLKNKQANVLEEATTNELNEQILKLNLKTDKQGTTLMAFTFITTLFLPLSFMTSFFALNIDEFPRSGPSQMLSLSFVTKYTFAISLGFTIGFGILAFNMRRLGILAVYMRQLGILAVYVKRLVSAFKKAMSAMLDFLKQVRHRSKTEDIENSANTANAPANKSGNETLSSDQSGDPSPGQPEDSSPSQPGNKDR